MKPHAPGMPARATSTIRLLLLALVLAAGACTARAGGLGDLLGGGEPDLLPVEQAFPLNVEMVAPDRVVATWETAKGYYLYRDKLGFSLDGTDNTVERVETPPGEVEDDPTFGRLEVYHGPVSASIYLAHPAHEPFTLVVRYQGCADAGVCYPPQTDRMGVSPASASGPGDGAGTAAGVSAATSSALWSGDFTRLTEALNGGRPALIIGVFLAAGLLLAFSACLYPMIPILSGLIAGDRHRGSAWRAFALSLVYVESTAVTYAVIGTLAGWTGAAIQVDMQSPWVLGAFALLFVALALSMFGLYDLQLPSRWQTRLSALSARQRPGTFLGVAIMGVLSTMIVGACSGPALAAALAFIARTGDAGLGALALFALANGMGIPLLVIGTGAGRWLPRAGGWMETVRRVFGVGFLAVALWMVARFLPASVILALW
ncbi:MAG TPA: protein-disulfide reductase DsbD, partial [Gammaproteobacteria bacterium]|nr:protein-disulfide reductase DsbD [Gammaproteobacteria bacterium]